ncbi:Bug family tripartite tricarboxylate transporter substrate binding protein [Caenimonas terrae]|uniref:Bug family tripartite tricarboxylate transporter substrate binding protein n=1 Tax=Caenimonas terrae TaxID=696074 RepID=A0ABW0NFX4_9BURK
MISRRHFTRALAAAPLAGYAAASLADTDYPHKPIRLLVGLAPGGIADITARFIAPRLGEILGRQVFVENRTGAGGAIATRAVATSAPDGYTLLMAFDGTHVTLPAANPGIGFEPVGDFAMIGKVVDAPVMITSHPSFPAKDFGQFIALSRRMIGASTVYDYGTAGVASTGHLTMELLKQRLGFFAVHIPYRGGGDARAQVLGKQIPLMLAAVPATSGDVRSGALKGLAVTSAQRSPVLPGVPTLAELGYKETAGLDINSWVGLMAPSRTPPAIIARLDAALRETLATDDVHARLLNSGATPVKSSPELFRAQVSSDLARWKGVIRDSHLQLQA